MLEKFRDWFKYHNVLQQGDRIVTGVSGGADSVCLLCLLAELRREYDLTLYAVHVHHGIRGPEADRDAAFVEALCERLGVTCRVVYRDVPALAAAEHRSEEEMGRRVRYQVLEECRREWDCRWIAVAHNREDQAETVLWNLCRGTGLAGLAGIAPVRDRIIRPLLSIRRREIEEWLAERGQPYCTDRTNEEDEYTRNRIRHHVLPLLEESVNRQTVEHIAEAAERLQSIREYLEEQVRRQLAQIDTTADGRSLWRAETYHACAAALQPDVILGWCKQVSGRAADFGAEHVRTVAALFDGQVGREAHLPHGLLARRTYEGVVLVCRSDNQTDTTVVDEREKPEISMEIWDLEEEGSRIQTVSQREITFLGGKIVKIPESGCVKWFDYDKIKNTLVVRTREPGDRLVIHPDGTTKKLKNYWIDRKVPQEERDGRWLLAAGSEILWILGDRTGEGCRIDGSTRRILKVQLKNGGKDHG